MSAPQDEPVATETDIHSNFNACMHRDYCRQLKRERDAALEALKDIVDPISALKRSMQAVDVLNGQMAYQLSNDPEHLKSVARATLRAIEEGRK